MKTFTSVSVVLLLGTLLFTVIDFEQFPADRLKNYYFQHGSQETGAVNLVTAIYLGYRAFDTLGETVVLLLSIGGVLFLLGKDHA